ncbi:hypothetical protein C6A85_000000102525 [Mycobacterium sp. ITM-2017-0098]|nr:hypothetical protein C6A85_000000102525 [Mycobacterium sp. ITM-2017-0098]
MKLAAAAIAAAALVVCATPAAADSQDQQFFSTLDGLGFVMTDPPLLISQGAQISQTLSN